MLGEMNPGVVARDWALSPAPLCPGLSLVGLQRRAEGLHCFSSSSGMQLVRTILTCWRKGVEGRWTRQKADKKKHKLLLLQRDVSPTSRVCSPCPVPLTPGQECLMPGTALLQGQGDVRKCLATKIPKYKKCKKVLNTMDLRDALLFLLLCSSPGPKHWTVTEKVVLSPQRKAKC